MLDKCSTPGDRIKLGKPSNRVAGLLTKDVEFIPRSGEGLAQVLEGFFFVYTLWYYTPQYKLTNCETLIQIISYIRYLL